MHPAFSVIVFTTLSGAGYGLWFWLALAPLLGAGRTLPATGMSTGLLLGFVLVSLGLLSSLAHLGQPQRAWRALSQWRSSWLSREGVLALATYVPAGVLLVCGFFGIGLPPSARIAVQLALAAGALLTVACTAMIYASLTPIPAWRHPLVLPGYLGFALLTGGFLAAACLTRSALPLPQGLVLIAGAATAALALVKSVYWQALDQPAREPTVASAVGLPAGSTVRAWEAPHTEASYLNREMGYVLARRHRQALRCIALLLFAVLPGLLMLPALLLPHLQGPLLVAAALCAIAGALVERWLFFAEARHLVQLYYG